MSSAWLGVCREAADARLPVPVGQGRRTVGAAARSAPGADPSKAPKLPELAAGLRRARGAVLAHRDVPDGRHPRQPHASGRAGLQRRADTGPEPDPRQPSGLGACRAAAALSWGSHFHELRHVYASLPIAAGQSVKVVQSRLGHATADETLNTYAHLWPDSEDRSRAAVDRGLGDSLTAHRRPSDGPETHHRRTEA